MCGFFFALLGIFLVLKLLGCGRRCRRRRGRGRHRAGRSGLSFLFQRLGTESGQEETIRDILEEFQATTKEVRGEVFEGFETIADALTGEDFEHGVVGEVWARQDDSIEKVRLAATRALGQIHAVLNQKQRERLAELIKRGRRSGPFGAAWMNGM